MRTSGRSLGPGGPPGPQAQSRDLWAAGKASEKVGRPPHSTARSLEPVQVGRPLSAPTSATQENTRDAG